MEWSLSPPSVTPQEDHGPYDGAQLRVGAHLTELGLFPKLDSKAGLEQERAIDVAGAAVGELDPEHMVVQ